MSNEPEVKRPRLRRIKPKLVPLPKTREPFVNIPFKSLGIDARGNERFWMSSVNQLFGAKGVIVDEWGECRVYPTSPRHTVLYTAAQDAGDPEILWLCGELNWITRLDLRTGKMEDFATGIRKARSFPGGIYDAATGKLLVLSRPYQGVIGVQPTVAVIFDTRARRVVKTHVGCCNEGVARFAFPNGDGTHSTVVQFPGETILRWDPISETVSARVLQKEPIFSQQGTEKLTCRLVSNEHGDWYFPGRGWYDARAGTFTPASPSPEVEMTWFARRGPIIYGASARSDGLGETTVHMWDTRTGKVTYLLKIADCDIFGVNMTRSGKIVAFTVLGDFYRFDAVSGALEVAKILPLDEHGVNDAFCRIDRDRVLGAPYISSQFWELNLRTKQGQNAGRAHSGWGEICHAVKLQDKVYMTAYTSGELLEYDPQLHPHFPRNPRVVADPPLGMRPMAIATDEKHTLFYSCSLDYGRLGSVVTRYDTRTGRAAYASNPLKDQKIESLHYDRKSRSLICVSSPNADCNSAQVTAPLCHASRLDADDFSVKEFAPFAPDIEAVQLLGPLDGKRRLCFVRLKAEGLPSRLIELHRDRFALLADAAKRELPPASNMTPIYAGKPGRFILNIDDRLEIWDMRRDVSLGVLFHPFDTSRFDGYHVFVDHESVFIMRARELVVLEDCIKGL